jgi:hypothetical protein
MAVEPVQPRSKGVALMIFRHCWEYMLEVAPSRRSVVQRAGNEVLLAPIEPDALDRLCLLVRNSDPLPNPEGL